MATHYDDTDPASTTCGNGSHTVRTWHSWFAIKSSTNKIYARLDIRRSAYCDTVWIRATNLTGTCGDCASEQSITVDIQIFVYDCPSTTCYANGKTKTGQVLPNKNDTAWSNQFQLPLPGVINGAKQPPTIQGRIYVKTGGVSCCSADTFMAPIWTHNRNQIDLGDLGGGPNDPVLSCRNTTSNNCEWWGQSGGASVTVLYLLEPSLDTVSNANVSLKDDIKNVLLPAWSDLQPDSPHLTYCTNPATCNPDVAVFVGSAQYMGGAYGMFTDTTVTSTQPAKFVFGELRVNDPARVGTVWNHSCGAVDDGCGNPAWDDRIAISHEVGHSLGLGHCGLDRGVMCHTAGSPDELWSEGTSFWTPQGRDEAGILAVYP
jgi:hypothetical protein